MSAESETIEDSTVKINNDADSIISAYQNWLNKFAKKTEEIIVAGVLVQQGESYQTVAAFPLMQAMSFEIAELVEKVISTRAGVVIPKTAENTVDPVKFLLAYPVFSESELKAVLVLDLLLDNKSDLSLIMNKVEGEAEFLKNIWVDINLNVKEKNLETIADNIDLLAKVLSELHFDSAVMSFVTELSVLIQCQRVSFGIKKAQSIKLLHFSHNSKVSTRINIVRLLEEAMNEAADQKRSICLPEFDCANGIKTICLEHQQLIDKEEFSASILSIPLYNSEKELFAVITLERDQPFDQAEAYRVESLAAMSAIVLYEKKLNDRWIGDKVFDSLKTQLIRLFGKNYIGRKILASALLIFVIATQTVTTEYRLAAKAEIVATEQRTIVAPFDGYIETADYRLGDAIKAGATLVQLDNKDIRLDRIRLSSQISKLQKQKQKATALNEKAEINIVNAQIKEISVERQLVEMNLERSSIRSPIESIIIQGDLSQRLGANVSKGEVLFEIAPYDHYKINLKIPENRIKDIKLGFSGQLYLSALPKERFSFEIKKILPNLVVDDEGAFFIAEAHLIQDKTRKQLLLGMKGVAKILIDERLLLSIWTRDMADFVRLKYWIWWG